MADSKLQVFITIYHNLSSLEITVGHHLWKSVFEYNFQLSQAGNYTQKRSSTGDVRPLFQGLDKHHLWMSVLSV